MKILLCTLFISVVLLSIVSFNEAFPPSHDNSSLEVRCPPHEVYYECGADCQTECLTLNKPCTIRYIRCPSGCYCEEGYAREPKTSRCIPIEKCPNLGNSTERPKPKNCDESVEDKDSSEVKHNPHERWYYVLY